MNRLLVLSFMIVLFISCKKADAPLHPKKLTVEKVKAISKVKKSKVLGDYMGKDKYIFWEATQSDTAKYWVRLEFEEDFLVYQFHGQCMYYYFVNYYYTGTDKVELLWSYKEDCLRDMDFLKKSNGVKKYPKPGDAFCEYTLLNDSVIKVKYNFPKWTKKVNEIAKDSIFPNYLYLENENIVKN